MLGVEVMIKEVLTREEQTANTTEFVELLNSINRDGAKIDKLIDKLSNSDFFYAPASTMYHGAFPGGLCSHCLDVYYNLMHLIKYKQLTNIDEDSVKIVALLHDLDKMNKYEQAFRNVKKYYPEGSKSDSAGRFDWIEECYYKTKDKSEQFIYGSHEMNSEYMVRKFIPLKTEESVAILHHMGGMSWDSAKDDIGAIYTRCPLAMLLHLADMMASYIDANCENE